MLWKKENPIVEDDIKTLDQIYEQNYSHLPIYEQMPETHSLSNEIVSLNGKKGMWTLDEIINLLRKNEIRFKIVLD